MAETLRITQFQYAVPVKGAPGTLYIYKDGRCRSIYHFHDSNSRLDAMTEEMLARFKGLETRVTDGGDMLLLHSMNGAIVYPEGIAGGDFWKQV